MTCKCTPVEMLDGTHCCSTPSDECLVMTEQKE